MANEVARKLRRTMTRQELKLWLHLRELRKRGFHFRRQCPLDGYVIDFVCYHPKLAIEIDGSQHSHLPHKSRDAKRDAYLTASGFRVIRFWNRDIDENLEGVTTLILHELQSNAPHPAARRAPPPLPARGRDGVPGNGSS
jgi:very-short-patch-repair endonuclease